MNTDNRPAIRSNGERWLSARFALANIEAARPGKAARADFVVYDRDHEWFLPVKLTVLSTSGFRSEARYLGRRLALVYVLLGLPDGGPASRPATEAYLLTPEQAWKLPAELGRKQDPADDYYGFGGVPSALIDRLDQHRLSGGPALAGQLRDAARSLQPTLARGWRPRQARGLRRAIARARSVLAKTTAGASATANKLVKTA